MPDTPRPRRHSLLTDTDAKRILARAAELDARSGSLLTTNDLRQIAADAGISSDALERALWEDDIPEAAYFDPPLTTVRIDFDSRGRQTLFTLLAQIERAEMRPIDVPPPELVVRRSSGPAPSA